MEKKEAEALIVEGIQASIRVKERLLSTLVPEISLVAEYITKTLANGGKLFLCGNGGSAGDAQHIAAELIGRFEMERKAYPAIALTTNSSSITALANDYSYDCIFSRQIEALAQPGDLLIGITTSGNSGNVINAVLAANAIGAITVGLTGETGGKLADDCTVCLKVPSTRTARIQESHIMIGHLLCQIVETNLASTS